MSAVSLVGNPVWASVPSAKSSEQTSNVVVTHVLGFAANDHYENADALTKALKRVISSSTNVKLGEGDFSLEVLTAALGCSDVPDTTCLKKIADKTATNRFIWGTLDLNGQKVSVELHLYDVTGSEKTTKLSYQATLTDSLDVNLTDIAAKAVAELLSPLMYKVVISAPRQEGQILVDGEVAGRLSSGEATVETTSGKHVFRLEGAEQSPVETSARISIDGTNRVRFERSNSSPKSLAAKPVSQTQTQPFNETPGVVDVSHGNAQRTWGYVTLGAGGALLAAGGLAAGRIYMLGEDDGFKAYREGLSTNENACTEAKHGRVVNVDGASSPSDVRSLCNQADTLEVAQIVLLATGAVAVGTGLTLLLTSKPNTKTATTRIEPRISVGQDRANVGLFMRF
jgi:hypothetical protein